MESVKIIVTGDVQGVFYRHFAKKTAEKMGITGWAKNENDGSVTIVAQGSKEQIERYIEWAKAGSPMSKVENVTVEEIPKEEGLLGFGVK